MRICRINTSTASGTCWQLVDGRRFRLRSWSRPPDAQGAKQSISLGASSKTNSGGRAGLNRLSSSLPERSSQPACHQGPSPINHSEQTLTLPMRRQHYSVVRRTSRLVHLVAILASVENTVPCRTCRETCRLALLRRPVPAHSLVCSLVRTSTLYPNSQRKPSAIPECGRFCSR